MAIRGHSKHHFEISDSVERIFNNVYVVREGLVISSSKKKNKLPNEKYTFWQIKKPKISKNNKTYLEYKSSFAHKFFNAFYNEINGRSNKFRLKDIRRSNKKLCEGYTQKYSLKLQNYKFSSSQDFHSNGIKSLNRRNLGNYSLISQDNFTQNANVYISHHCILDDILKTKRSCFKNEKHDYAIPHGFETRNVSTYKLTQTYLCSNRLKSYNKSPYKYQTKKYIYSPLEHTKIFYKNIIFSPRNYGTVQGSMSFNSDIANKKEKYEYGADKLVSLAHICKSCASSQLSNGSGYFKNECNSVIDNFSLLQKNRIPTKNVTNPVLYNENKLYNYALERQYSEKYAPQNSIITLLNMHKVPGCELMISKGQERSNSLSLASKADQVQEQTDINDLVIHASYTSSLESVLRSPEVKKTDIGNLNYDIKSVSNLLLFAKYVSVLRVSENNIPYVEKNIKISSHNKFISKQKVLDETSNFKQTHSANVHNMKNRCKSDNSSSKIKTTHFLLQANDLFRMKYNYCIKFSILIENMDLILFTFDHPYCLLESKKVKETDTIDKQGCKYDSLFKSSLGLEKLIYNLFNMSENITTKAQKNAQETRSVQVLDIQSHKRLNSLSNVTSTIICRKNVQHELTFAAKMTDFSEDEIILTNDSQNRKSNNVKIIKNGNCLFITGSKVSRTEMISNRKIKLKVSSVLKLFKDTKYVPFDNFTVNASENDGAVQQEISKENMHAPVVCSIGKYDGVLNCDYKSNISVINILSKCENNNTLGYFQQKCNSMSNLYTCDSTDFVLFSYHSSNINIVDSRIIIDSIYYVHLNDLFDLNMSATCMNNMLDYRTCTPLTKYVKSEQCNCSKLYTIKYIPGSISNCRDIRNAIYESKTNLTFEGNNILYNIQSAEQQELCKLNKAKKYIVLSDCIPTKQLDNEAISPKLNSRLNNDAIFKHFSIIDNSKKKYKGKFLYIKIISFENSILGLTYVYEKNEGDTIWILITNAVSLKYVISFLSVKQ